MKELIVFKNFKLFDNLIKDEEWYKEEIPENFLSNLPQKLQNKNFILYGAGVGGFLFLEKEDFFGIPAYSPLRFNFTSNLFVIITVNKPSYVKEIIKFLLKFIAFEKIIIILQKVWGYLRSSLLEFKGKNNYLKSSKIYLKNKKKIIKVLNFFNDKISLEIYTKLVKSYTSRNFYSLPFSPTEEQYFSRDINLTKGYKRFIHCGAFIGDTIRQLMQIVGKIEALVYFEPDIINFNEAKEMFKLLC